MESKSNERSSSGASVVAVVLLIALVLLPMGYVLSTGPAIWMYKRGWLAEPAFIVYRPLEALCQYSAACGNVLEWYLDRWR